MNKSQKKTIYILVIIFLLLLSFFFLFKAKVHYSTWKSYHNYFEQPNQQIESWMSIKTISNKFNISNSEIIKEMGTNNTKINPHMSLDVYCKQYHKDCADLIERLNNLVGK